MENSCRCYDLLINSRHDYLALHILNNLKLNLKDFDRPVN